MKIDYKNINCKNLLNLIIMLQCWQIRFIIFNYFDGKFLDFKEVTIVVAYSSPF
jgi:hypothetical protein